MASYSGASVFVSLAYIFIYCSPCFIVKAQLYFDPDDFTNEKGYIDFTSNSSYRSWSSWSSSILTPYAWEDRLCEAESCGVPEQFRLCHCDALCNFFGDCCKDFNASDTIALNVFKDPDIWECVVFEHMCGDLIPDAYNYGFQLISDCPSSWPDGSVLHSCKKTYDTDPVVLDDRGLHFRNKDCAKCHGANMETLIVYLDFMDHPCPTFDYKCVYFPSVYGDLGNDNGTSRPSELWVPDPHLCLLDMVQSCPFDADTNDTIRKQCEEDFAPVFINGMFKNRECALCNGQYPLPEYSLPKCPGESLTHDEYVSCLAEPLYFSFFDYTKNQQIVANVFFGLSCAALMLTFITYCVFSSLRNIQGILVMQFIIALFVSQVLLQFFAQGLKPASYYESTFFNKQGTRACVIVACAAHFFSLSAFSLMSVMAWDLSKGLACSTAVARHDYNSKKRRFLYSMCGWGFPFLIVGPCLGVHIFSVKTGHFHYFYYGGSDCWLHPSLRCIQTFIVPVSVFLLFNLVIFIKIICQLRKIKEECKVLRKDQCNDQRWKDTAAALRLYIKISCLFGFGWLFGYLGAFVKVSQLWYVFIVLNSFQGVLFFFSFGMNARARKLWRTATTKQLQQFSTIATLTLSFRRLTTKSLVPETDAKDDTTRV